MNLTIDIGNTLIKMAVFDGGEIVEKLLAEECDTKLLDGLLARVALFRLSCDVSEDAVRCSFEALAGLSYDDWTITA